ncbi:N-acetylmuramoyl-L-alanine amidase, partial [Marivirga sericea]
MRKVFTLFINIISIQLQAQEGNIHTSFPLNNDANQRMIQESNFSFTAIALKSKEIRDFSSIGFINSADTIYFNNDLHSDNADGYFHSSLIHFEQAIKSIDLYIPSEVQDLNVVLINGSGEYSDFSPRKTIMNQSSDCELSGVVQQSEWRVGLPEPSYTRIFTDTGNMIVHHSAGSNNTIDFTQAVRDIYIYHTQENGWSDIGYNYLVAPNGTVYAGRDPAGGEQDQVMGAHFCGSNSNTMGICLMGNYETIEPTSELLESLESLISWKAFKDDLPVLESKFHPLNPELGVIAGHRDGCSTLCPGDNVYLKLQEIRENVNSQLVICRDDNGGVGDGGEDDGGEGDDDGGDG